MTDTANNNVEQTINQQANQLSNVHIADTNGVDDTSTTIQSKNAAKNKKKRDKAKAKKLLASQQNTDNNITNGSSNATTSTATTTTEQQQNDSTRSLLLNQYFTKHSNKQCELKYSSDKGRYVNATKDITQGHTLFATQPYILIINDTYIRQICHYCCNMSDKIQCCNSCNMAYYCSNTCRHNATDIHKLECDTLGQLHTLSSKNIIQGETASLRGVIRILYMKYNEKQKQKQFQDKLNKIKRNHSDKIINIIKTDDALSSIEYNTLITHSDKLDAQIATKTKQVLERIGSIVDKDVWTSTSDTLGIYMSLRCNAHQITTYNKQHIAFALYLSASMMNHSCLPNCIYYYNDNKHIVMRTIQNIQQNNELTFAYTNLYEKRNIRQQHLNDVYFIEQCNCNRCIVPLEQSFDRYIQGYICDKCVDNDDNHLLQKHNDTHYICTLCNTEYSIESIQTVEQTSQMLLDNSIQLAQAQQSNQVVIDNVNNKILPMLSKMLHKYNVRIFNLYTLLVTLYDASEQLHLAYDAILYCIDAMSHCELYNHPELAAMYLYKAQAAMLIRQNQNDNTDTDIANQYKDIAKHAVNTSVNIYDICFGQNHVMTKLAKKHQKIVTQ